MGSEGYLINQFIVARTNHRDDALGRRRTRTASASPLEIVRRRARPSARDFIVIYRLSMLDLVEGGSTWDEVA